MELFDKITGQIDSVRLPLFAVTLTALPRANTPVLLILHWHGSRPDADARAVGDTLVARLPVPGSALQINANWNEIAGLDGAMLDAAWQLGAWELDRDERRGCNTIGASEREALECRQAFGEDPFTGAAGTLVVAEAPDREEMLRLGARFGYIRWKFRPVRGGVWCETAEDDTLAHDGGRRLPCPVGVKAPVGTRVSRTRYHLGRVNRIILSG
jgi:hypothetical protein